MGAMGLRNPWPVEDPGTILDSWESSAIPARNRDFTAGSLMEEAQGVYQTNCVYMHIHTPHFGRCSSKASSVEYLYPQYPWKLPLCLKSLQTIMTGPCSKH